MIMIDMLCQSHDGSDLLLTFFIDRSNHFVAIQVIVYASCFSKHISKCCETLVKQQSTSVS